MSARLAKLGQHPAAGLWMHERDPGTVRAGARRLVNQPHPFCLQGGQALLQVGAVVGDARRLGVDAVGAKHIFNDAEINLLQQFVDRNDHLHGDRI